MTLKLAEIPNRTPVKLTLSVDPDIFQALSDYADIYEQTYGRREEIEQIAPMMLATFLSSDAAFKRARRDLHARREDGG